MRGVIDDIHLANTAASIRERTGAETTYKPAELAAGVDEVYEAGIKAMWDALLNGGKRTNVEYIFNRWQCEYIRPTYVVMGTSRPINAFGYNASLKKIEKKYFDFSGYSSASDTASTNGNYQVCFYCTSLEVFEDIGLPAGYYYQTWERCFKLHTIELVRSRKTTQYYRAFEQCTELVYIRFEGEIGQNISFVHCSKLSVESLKDIILHLSDYSGTADEYTKTLTLSSNSWAVLDAEGATAPGDVTWRDYVNILGWNKS